MANPTFTKTGNYYITDFSVDASFNLHLELPEAGHVQVFQKTPSAAQEYANTANWSNSTVIDSDFIGKVFPKQIKIVSQVNPSSCIVTEES